MQEGTEKIKSVKKRWLAVLLAVLIFLAVVLGVLQIGVVYSRNAFTYWFPDYERVDIAPLLEKEELTDEDYRVLYEQTGLTKIGVDDLLAENNTLLIMQIQDCYFGKYEVTEDIFGPFTYMSELDSNAKLTTLKDGDILVAPTTYTSWFRYGHSALVVDGVEKRVLESVSMGVDSEIGSSETFRSYASFIVLRPKVAEETRKAVAAYALENLAGVPYRVTTGVLSEKFKEPIGGSHCGHIVWYAYKKFGVDLDATGGGVVTPRDMVRSPLVDVVQVFGIDPDSVWGKYGA